MSYLQVTTHDTATDSRALYEVLMGAGSWMTLRESEERAESGSRYEEIFSADDARPLAESAQYVFTIEIELDPDIDLAAFHHWYNTKHVPIVAPAGLLRGRRWHDLDHVWRFLATYDMADRDVLDSDALARVRGFDEFTPQVTIRQRTVLGKAGPSWS
ncbi:hypothetical protein [Amycolatopsis jejuensis]|uniref:hypothetical protein n=1 Tax=Amycolatopsis jejuensis TaxID=330084 RepID=UPI0005256D77|nr:hypothetical protein [Amycolatopsis jejuensis]